MTVEPITNQNAISMFLHCKKCFQEKPGDISMRDFARLEIGWTPVGIQVWCLRHDINIVHVDFEGQKHPANLTAINPDLEKVDERQLH